MSHSQYARRKAIRSTALFILVGLLSFWRYAVWPDALPLIIFYIVLVINTFFCVRCFADLVPRKNLGQMTIDIILGLNYLILALSLGNQLLFVYLATLLFAIATLKYISLLSLIGYSPFLQRKIFIDSFGIIACLLALGGVLLGYGRLASWLWVGVFILANIHLLSIKPMYNFPADISARTPRG